MEQTNHNFLNGGGQAGISDRMRDLLSQAAQEHTSEQKSQGAVNEEMRQRLEGMEWLLRELREHELTALAESVTTVQGRVDDFLARPPEKAGRLSSNCIPWKSPRQAWKAPAGMGEQRGIPAGPSGKNGIFSFRNLLT